jgi:hypothetical protein
MLKTYAIIYNQIILQYSAYINIIWQTSFITFQCLIYANRKTVKVVYIFIIVAVKLLHYQKF